jgi:cytochrome c biogenesis protein CcmG, thiol:disulfide interchange protein DsbE
MPALRRWSLLLGLLLLACDSETSAAPSASRGGTKAGFRLPTIDGRKLGPGDFKGKVVVADFWATWCGPCYMQADILHRLHAQYPAKDVQFLAIDVGEDEKTVRAFLAKRPIPYPVLLDEDQRVSGDLGVVGFPTLLIVDKKGEVSYLRTGIVPDKRLRELLAQAGVPPPAGLAPTPPPVRPASALPKPAVAPKPAPPEQPVGGG